MPMPPASVKDADIFPVIEHTLRCIHDTAMAGTTTINAPLSDTLTQINQSTLYAVARYPARVDTFHPVKTINMSFVGLNILARNIPMTPPITANMLNTESKVEDESTVQ